MRILVTGGTGFIGSHLCKVLLEQGHYVICLDNNFTGSMDTIKEFRTNINFEFIRHDITLPIYLEVDQIYHLACPASPKAYQYNGIKTIKTNILGTMNVLGIAKRVKARILLTSTSEVYGDPTVSPQSEEYWGNVNTIGIRSCYDEGKRLAETLMMEYHRSRGIDIRIVRIFNTYGPNMDPNDGRVISNFINQCIKNEAITIYGDGSQTRSFCYISDMVNGLVKMMNSETVGTGPINLGNPVELTIKEIATIIKEKTKSKSNIMFMELPQDDPKQRKPDISKAKKYLDFKPTISLDKGLDKTIHYFNTINEII
jgi:UDP-glucuronate decarboxylase